MTDPLIDRDALDDVLDGHLMYLGKERIAAADAVLAYLRSVLTPEALEATGSYVRADGSTYTAVRAQHAHEVHRRIFGEDQ